MPDGLILGLNAYTHSAAACLLDAGGRPLYVQAKERLTRKKHDGGDVSEVVADALEAVGATLADLDLVVANNHLFRIDRFEETLAWSVALYHYRASYLDEHNLLPGVPRRELSHHLAHAWSGVAGAPFASGLVVVMDGMGSALHDVELPGEHYHGEFALTRDAAFHAVPEGLEEGRGRDAAYGWREGESAYRFDEKGLTRLFKRWIAEPTPTFLHNYGFENMESLGAVYSRVSSHVFGDWNACGKVMGLAPWAEAWNAAHGGWSRRPVMRGPLEELRVDWPRLRAEPHPNDWEREEARPAYAALAADVQADLEDVVLDFLVRLRERSGERRLVWCGGVALNSTLNGRIVREAGFDEVWIPPWPGDEGIAVGCAHWGRRLLHDAPVAPLGAPRAARERWPLGLGRTHDADARASAVEAHAGWLEDAGPAEPGDVAQALAEGAVVAWFGGRSEFGPRALGHRSILADPRDAGMVARINDAIKKREAFRPFAPAVLAEHAGDWFDPPAASPYMSLTAPVRLERRTQVPAVVHQDGSARLQTVDAHADPAYRALIEAFHARTGVPMVLNTSFNVRGEPIVETPEDAVRTFLHADLDLLVLEDRCYRARAFPDPLPGSLRPRALADFTAEVVSDAEGEARSVRVMARGRTEDLTQLELGVLEAADGETAVGELVEHFAASWDVPDGETVAALQRLWNLRLLHFGG